MLTGKVAVVTGSSRGIGRAIAHRFAAEGALVVVHYSGSTQAAQETVAAIQSKGSDGFAVQADLSSLEQIETFWQSVDRELLARRGDTAIDILVNNAGMGSGKFEATTGEEFDRVFAVNVRGAFFLTQKALSRLRDGGRIINVSSGMSRRPSAEMAAYSLTKASIDAFTLMLAARLGPRQITVNTLAPGWTQTDINADYLSNPAFAQTIIDRTALGRLGQTEDIAKVAAFLASSDSDWVTGQYIEASGGFRLV